MVASLGCCDGEGGIGRMARSSTLRTCGFRTWSFVPVAMSQMMIFASAPPEIRISVDVPGRWVVVIAFTKSLCPA